jgi:hypothetical protein
VKPLKSPADVDGPAVDIFEESEGEAPLPRATRQPGRTSSSATLRDSPVDGNVSGPYASGTTYTVRTERQQPERCSCYDVHATISGALSWCSSSR